MQAFTHIGRTTATTEASVITAFYHFRNKALSEQEPFDLTVQQWIAHWRSSPHRGELGYMVRLDDRMPWSTLNMQFRRGTSPRGHTVAPRREPLGRTLTVGEWVQELRAQA